MAVQLDSSLYSQRKTLNLADLADSFLGTKKYLDAKKLNDAQLALQQKQSGFAQNADTRAGAEEERQVKEFNQKLADHALTLKDNLKKRHNDLFGEQAEIMATLPSNEREDYYQAHLIPTLSDAGYDTSDMPDYSDDLIHAWRMNAMTPADRSDERTKTLDASTKALNADAYDRAIDGKTGNYVYVPKDPRSGLPNVPTEIQAPPQIGYGQGPNGPYQFTTPRSGQNPTGAPIIGPSGTPVEAKKVPIPATVQKDLRNNISQLTLLNTISMALKAPNVDPTGLDKALISKLPYIGEKINASLSPNTVKSRIALSNLGDMEIFDITGKASSAKELERYKKWIPDLDADSKKIVITKLANFQKQLELDNEHIRAQYTNDQGYREDPLIKGQGQSFEPKVPPKVLPKVVTPADIDSMTDDEVRAYLGADTTGGASGR